MNKDDLVKQGFVKACHYSLSQHMQLTIVVVNVTRLFPQHRDMAGNQVSFLADGYREIVLSNAQCTSSGGYSFKDDKKGINMDFELPL